MMTRRFLFLVSAALTAFSQVTPQRLEEQAQAFHDAGSFTGAAIVAQDGKALFSKGFGMANIEWSIPNMPDTRFRLGSITKQFTGMTVLLLEQQGKLKTADPVCAFVEACPEAWKPITVHHLLTHTSGIPNFTSFPDYTKTMALASPPAESLKRFRDKPLDFDPGTKMSYSNSGYVLLGYIVEKASGVKYDEYLRTSVLAPLGMNDTGYDWNSTVLARRASGYESDGKALRNASLIDMSIPHAAGSMYSTTLDLVKWDAALRAGKLLSAESYRKYFTPALNDYAYGWNVRDRDGVQVVSHGGGINGFATMILRVPSKNLVVVTLSNSLPSQAGKLAQDLLSLSLGKEVEKPVKLTEITVPVSILSKYVGEYALSPTFILTVSLDGDQLVTQATGQPKIPIFAKSETAFFPRLMPAEIIFEADGSALTLVQNGRRMPAKRK
jgi:CubicO group peptidase (beta-lactamase class C family)